MDAAHYVYSPLKRAELVMIAYNTIIPLDMPKMTIEESVDVIDKHTTLVNCMGKMQKSEITSISVYEFVNPNEVRQISIIETYYKNKKRTKVGYRYFDEQNENVNPFSLGSLKYIITFDPFSKNAYFNTEINKHVLSYVKELFKEDIFEFANYDIDIKNYLLDLANDTKTIMDRRNPSAHGAFMSIDEAEVCANYLMKVKKVIYHFVSKIKEEYRKEI